MTWTVSATVIVLLGTLASLLVGYAMAKRRYRSGLHVAVYLGLLSMTTYVILDIDHPRFGFARIDAAYRALTNLRTTIK